MPQAQKPLVAVEDALDPVADTLRREGYRVVPLRDPVPEGVQAVVTTGGDVDLMGMLDIKTKSPVIVAAGKSPQQVSEEVRRALRRP
ncbi:MAG TPA: YkuS family protein [Firmicutes bacterium]|nr:YkuS family protein [Bacillota bacterium]